MHEGVGGLIWSHHRVDGAGCTLLSTTFKTPYYDFTTYFAGFGFGCGFARAERDTNANSLECTKLYGIHNGLRSTLEHIMELEVIG